MEKLTKSLKIKQLDSKIKKISVLDNLERPPGGWINAIRTTLNISLNQLGAKMGITAQSVKEIELREVNKSVSLKVLMETAEALDLRFVYGFIPNDQSLDKMIEKKAYEKAKEIVLRTSHSMSLENQKTGKERLRKAIKERAELIKNEMPKYIWD